MAKLLGPDFISLQVRNLSALLTPMGSGSRPTRTPGSAFLWVVGKSARSLEGTGRVQDSACATLKRKYEFYVCSDSS